MDNSKMKSLTTKNVLPEISVEELEPRLEMAILTVPKAIGFGVNANSCNGHSENSGTCSC